MSFNFLKNSHYIMMKVTVGQFQDLYKVSESPLEPEEKVFQYVKILTEMDDRQVDKLSVTKFNKIAKQAAKSLNGFMDVVDSGKPAKFIRVNGTTYQLHYDITRMDAGRYVEGVTFSSDPIGNLHKLLASMAVPMRWTWKGLRAQPYDADRHEKVAADMLQADFRVAYHAAVFFYALLKELMSSSSISGSPAEMEVMDRLGRLSERFLGGSITASWYRNLKASS